MDEVSVLRPSLKKCNRARTHAKGQQNINAIQRQTMTPMMSISVTVGLVVAVCVLKQEPVEAWTTSTKSSFSPRSASDNNNNNRPRSHDSVLSSTFGDRFDTPTTTSPIMAAYEAHSRGQDALDRGATNAAVSHHTTAVELNPNADRYFRLGHALEENGESMPAIEAFDKAKEMAGNDAELIRDVNLKLANLWSEHVGDYDKAIFHVDAVLAQDVEDEDAVAIDQKAFFLAATGKYEEAIALWDKALALKDDGSGDEVDDDAKLYRAIAKDLIGATAREDGQDDDDDMAAMNDAQPYKVDSWNYATNHPPQTEPDYWHSRLFSGTATLLRDALGAARPDGLICEFGVFHGKSIRLLASMVNNDDNVDGFDTFEGIPEEWGDEPAGSYTAAAEIPERCPDNVRFHVGLFADTLPGYVESTVESPETTPVRLINVDCDLYQGTVEIMDFLAPRIGPGTVIVFDEYLMTPTWVDDEYKAFQEAVEKFAWKYDYLAYSLFSKQAVVRITESASFVGPPAE